MPLMLRIRASPGRLAPSQETSAVTPDTMPSEGPAPAASAEIRGPSDDSALRVD
jgi:hypothetical protein